VDIVSGREEGALEFLPRTFFESSFLSSALLSWWFRKKQIGTLNFLRFLNTNFPIFL